MGIICKTNIDYTILIVLEGDGESLTFSPWGDMNLTAHPSYGCNNLRDFSLSWTFLPEKTSKGYPTSPYR